MAGVTTGTLHVAAMARVFREVGRRFWHVGNRRVQPVDIQAVREGREVDLAIGDGGRNVLGEIEVIGRLVAVGDQTLCEVPSQH